jgi:hypothetical protein
MSTRNDRIFSAIIKLDNSSKRGAERVVSDAIRSARKNAPGARGTFMIGETSKLAGAGSMKALPYSKASLSRSRGQDWRCRATMSNGKRCEATAIEGNYGFCGRHREEW